MVHDLKNPLAVIEAGIIPLLDNSDKYGPLTEKQRKILIRVLRNTKIAKTLVNDMLEVGRSDAGIFQNRKILISEFVKSSLIEIFDLADNSLVEDIKDCMNLSEMKAALAATDIILEIDEPLWNHEVCLDGKKVVQILRNLLNNAFKFRAKTVKLGVEKDNGHLTIFVADDGKGIKKSDQEKIFQCYFQLDKERDFSARGHGLGLAGVLVLVEDMGGQMSIESEKEKGAKFFVKLPLKEIQ